MSLVSQQKIPPALEILESMLKLYPGFVRGRIQTAKVYYQLCATTKGRAHLDAALDARPTPEERRDIEAIRIEQTELDVKRMQRPDFAALNRPKSKRAEA